jgi:hypothetical protein
MDMNPETIQQRIQIARRDAEALKDRIKRKKDELADTTRELFPSSLFVLLPTLGLELAQALLPMLLPHMSVQSTMLTFSFPCSPRSRSRTSGTSPTTWNENKENSQRSFG